MRKMAKAWIVGVIVLSPLIIQAPRHQGTSSKDETPRQPVQIGAENCIRLHGFRPAHTNKIHFSCQSFSLALLYTLHLPTFLPLTEPYPIHFTMPKV